MRTHLATIVSVSLASLASLASVAGCTSNGDSTDDGKSDGGDGDAELIANVELSSAGGGALTVREGDGIRLRLTGNGVDYSGTFNPASGLYSPIDLFSAGTYTFWAEFINDYGGVVTVIDVTDSIALDLDGVTSVDVNLAIGNGFFTYNWALEDQQQNAISSCGDVVGEAGVSMLATLAGSTDAFDDLFNCEDGFNNPSPVPSDPLPIGNYVIVGSIINSAGQALGTSEPLNASLEQGNEYEDLLIGITLGN